MAEEVLTAAILNVDLRDNLLVLSTHAHTGAAGIGDDELSGVDSIAFDDLAASPNVAGELQRNGVNLEWYGAAVVKITEADAAAVTASPRTLGTGAQQAATGNHTHIPALVGQTRDENEASVVTSATSVCQVGLGLAYTEVASAAHTPAATNRSVVVVAAVTVKNSAFPGNTFTLRILKDTVEQASRAVTAAAGSVPSMVSISLGWVDANPTVAAHTYSAEVKMGTDRPDDDCMGASIEAVEVKA